MATSPMPVPQQPAQQPANPSVAQNIMPIAEATQQAAQGKPGVTESQLGATPQAKPDEPSKKRVVLSILGAAAGLGPMVQQIDQKHNQNTQLRNQHVIDTVWQSHNNETQARNRVQQLQQIVQDTDQHMKEAQALPDDDPTKVQKIGYLAHIHQQVVGEIVQQAQIIQSSQQTTNALLSDSKNRKILSKAVGYDEKTANAPERQQMIAAIKKSIPGTGDESAALQSQFPQGSSQGQPGLTPAVQAETIKGATAQAQIEGRQNVAQTRGAAQEDTAKIRAGSVKGKTGVLFDQGVPYAWTSPDGKQYTAEDPNIPPEGKMLLASAKAARAEYEKVKGQAGSAAMLRAQTGYDNYLMHSQGIGPDKQPLAGSIQTDQGQTVGTANAPNVRPTGTERQRADLAASATEQIANLEDILKKRSDLFGPVAGRKTNFTQWIGSQDPDAQAFAAAARITADHLAGVFGGRSEAALEGIYNVIGRNATNPAAAIAALKKMNQAAKTIQGKGTVHTVGSSTQLGSSTPPKGATQKVPGSDGHLHWSDGKNDLGIVQ